MVFYSRKFVMAESKSYKLNWHTASYTCFGNKINPKTGKLFCLQFNLLCTLHFNLLNIYYYKKGFLYISSIPNVYLFGLHEQIRFYLILKSKCYHIGKNVTETRLNSLSRLFGLKYCDIYISSYLFASRHLNLRTS